MEEEYIVLASEPIGKIYWIAGMHGDEDRIEYHGIRITECSSKTKHIYIGNFINMEHQDDEEYDNMNDDLYLYSLDTINHTHMVFLPEDSFYRHIYCKDKRSAIEYELFLAKMELRDYPECDWWLKSVPLLEQELLKY